jgi:hypothetical protein
LDQNQAEKALSNTPKKSDKLPIAELFKDIEEKEEATCCGNAWIMF